jgi:hypothetical protein
MLLKVFSHVHKLKDKINTLTVQSTIKPINFRTVS